EIFSKLQLLSIYESMVTEMQLILFLDDRKVTKTLFLTAIVTLFTEESGCFFVFSNRIWSRWFQN
ncbi:hypothetical protein, partial [Halanaerobium sp.]|uniref:hypothetical protein n=1 Tax=Halanaerobium sp. TaxID=1895664 RepID=UPI0025B876C9